MIHSTSCRLDFYILMVRQWVVSRLLVNIFLLEKNTFKKRSMLL